MSKKTLLIIIILLIAILVLWWLFSFLGSRDRGPSGEEGTNFFSTFNPFRKQEPVAPSTPSTDGTFEPVAEVQEIKLRRISSMPVAGFTVFQKERFKEIPEVIPETGEGEENTEIKTSEKPTPPPTEFAPAVRYVARATGNIYQTFADNLDERRFSATLIPKVYEAFLGNSGESAIMRYLGTDDGTIISFSGNLPKDPLGGDLFGENEIKGSFLPETISDISLSPDHTKIFYLLPTGNGVAGITAGIAGDKKSQVFDSPFTEWLSQWPKNNLITLTTKPSFGVPGHMYAVNPDKKDLNRVLGDIAGLTTLTSPNGELVLVANNNLSLSIYDMKTKSTSLLGARTMPEKCVWTKTSNALYCSVPKNVTGASYPDFWYRGEISFSDEIWKIEVENQNGTIISSLVSERGLEDMDNIKLVLDAEENYLFFVNKKDSLLWELSLN
jgi:hypothetical protein